MAVYCRQRRHPHRIRPPAEPALQWLGYVVTLSLSKGSLSLPLSSVAEREPRLSVVEKLSALVTANLQRATRLRQSILQQAFEGNLCRNRLRASLVST